ncbi:hypothetical protein D3C71_216710 [compost metagenome]
MVGHITLALRRRDGTTEFVGVPAKDMKRVMTDEVFMEGSLEPVEKYIRGVIDDGEFSFGRQAPVPGDYGMVIIDEVARRVVNWSHFDSVSRLAWYDLGFRGYGRIMDDVRYEAPRSAAMAYGDRLRYWDPVTSGFVTKDIRKPQSTSALAKIIEDHANEDDLRSTPEAEIVLRSPRWEVIELQHMDEPDFHVCRTALEEFAILDANERRLWDDEYRKLHESKGDYPEDK